MTIRESELYLPLKKYLTEKGYTVYGEVLDCDLVAVQNNNPVIIELKKNISLKLVMQGTKRQEFADSVYLAVPQRENQAVPPSRRDVIKLLKRLGLGLIIIYFRKERKEEVRVILNPGPPSKRPKKNYKKRKALFKEIGERYRDFNTGGTPSSIETITAYRLKALHIAVLLHEEGELSPAKLISYGTASDTNAILAKNYYGWFIRIRRGIYALSERGKLCFSLYPEQTAYFRNQSRNVTNN